MWLKIMTITFACRERLVICPIVNTESKIYLEDKCITPETRGWRLVCTVEID